MAVLALRRDEDELDRVATGQEIGQQQLVLHNEFYLFRNFVISDQFQVINVAKLQVLT